MHNKSNHTSTDLSIIEISPSHTPYSKTGNSLHRVSRFVCFYQLAVFLSAGLCCSFFMLSVISVCLSQNRSLQITVLSECSGLILLAILCSG